MNRYWFAKLFYNKNFLVTVFLCYRYNWGCASIKRMAQKWAIHGCSRHPSSNTLAQKCGWSVINITKWLVTMQNFITLIPNQHYTEKGQFYASKLSLHRNLFINFRWFQFFLCTPNTNQKLCIYLSFLLVGIT